MENLLIDNQGIGFWVLLIWSAAWKLVALWRAGHHGRKAWFVALLLINTLGILEIIYIFFIDKPKAFNQKQEQDKEAHLDIIREYMKTHDEVASGEIEKLMEVSRATAERYLDVLEKQGFLTQVGDAGRGVVYKKR